MSQTPAGETQSNVSESSSGVKKPTFHVIQLPKCTGKIKIKVMQNVMQSMVNVLYEMELNVHLTNTLKRDREKLARTKKLRGWPLPRNGYSFRLQPPGNHADYGERLPEGARKTFQKLGIRNGDAILVVPSSFPVHITGIGENVIPVNIRSSDKVGNLREVLQGYQTENLPANFKFLFKGEVMDDEMLLELYGLRRGSRIIMKADN